MMGYDSCRTMDFDGRREAVTRKNREKRDTKPERSHHDRWSLLEGRSVANVEESSGKTATTAG